MGSHRGQADGSAIGAVTADRQHNLVTWPPPAPQRATLTVSSPTAARSLTLTSD